MAAHLELRQKQRTVIVFLVAEGEAPVNIHRRLQNVYKENTLNYSNVRRWVYRLTNEKLGTASVADKPRSGVRPRLWILSIKQKQMLLATEDRRLPTIISSAPWKRIYEANIMPVTRKWKLQRRSGPKNSHQNVTRQEYMLSFEGGTLLLIETVTMLTK